MVVSTCQWISVLVANANFYLHPSNNFLNQFLTTSHLATITQLIAAAYSRIEHLHHFLQATITIIKNPGLGFSVAGGIGLQGNPYRPLDEVSSMLYSHAC